MSNASLPSFVADDSEWIAFSSDLDKLKREKFTVGPVNQPFSVSCEICDKRSATLYCNQDKAHLCTECDAEHHSKTKLLMKHTRQPVYHSPYQFGACATHTSYKYETVCLECGLLLCELCLLVGEHAKNDEFRNHPIVSTIEAFRYSISVDTLDSSLDGSLLVVSRKKDSLIQLLKRHHAQVVQAESNHLQIQQALDRQLGLISDQLEKIKRKRIDYVSGLRRETLLALTLVEWYEAFVVHARLSLPPSLWLAFFHRVNLPCMRELIFGSVMDDGDQESRIKKYHSVEEYIGECLGAWAVAPVDIEGFLEVYRGRPLGLAGKERFRERMEGALKEINNDSRFSSTFQLLPPPTVHVENKTIVLSPEQLRLNRMKLRMEELLTKPQVDGTNEGGGAKITMPFPDSLKNPNEAVPLENIKDFVMQTLAVLSHSEKGLVSAPLPTDNAGKGEVYLGTVSQPPIVTHNAVIVPGVPPTIISSTSPPVVNSVDELRHVLAGGAEPFSNAVSVVMNAPGSERQEIIKLFASLLIEKTQLEFEQLVRAICRQTVNEIDAPSFLVSGISVLVPLTACFSMSLFPKEFNFLDNQLRQSLLVLKSETESAENAETAVADLVDVFSSTIVFPTSARFLLKTVYETTQVRFGPEIALGVTSGLFLARLVAPRLLWTAPRNNDNIQAPPIVTLMARFIHRVASSAAEGGHTMINLANQKNSQDPQQRTLSACITKTNALIMRCVINAEDDQHCPSPTVPMSPKSAATRIQQKIRDYGHSIVYRNV